MVCRCSLWAAAVQSSARQERAERTVYRSAGAMPARYGGRENQKERRIEMLDMIKCSTGGAYFPDIQIDSFQDPSFLIFKPNIFITDFLFQGDLLRMFRIMDIRLRLQDLIDTLHRGQTFLDRINRLT